MVIDTPNRYEQSLTNYESIVNLLTNSFSKNPQLILCAMDNEKLKPFKDQANIIFIDQNKLLNPNKYYAIKEEFNLLEREMDELN